MLPDIDTIIAEVQQQVNLCNDNKENLKFCLSCVDLTTLEGVDNDKKVEQLCQKAKLYVPQVASVCVYPVFVKTAKIALKDEDIHVASVAGAFPSGQSPLSVKVAEVEYVVQQGADEIDMVISRGKFLDRQYDEVAGEIAAIRKACKHIVLKVILETGELQTAENIYHASMLAMQAGADFIKTSTGKCTVGATPQAVVVMLQAIKDFYSQTKKMVGLKVAGGITTTEDVLLYRQLVGNMLGEKGLQKKYFRIGTSRLADKLQAEILE